MNRVDKVIHYLNQNIHAPLSIDDIADVACLSPAQLYRVFKKTTGLTPIQYHEHLKLKESLHLLQQSERISDVAFELGYGSYESFYRAFKKIFNCTPSDVLWGISFLHTQPKEYNYVMVKEDASFSQIQELISGSKDILAPSDTLIYRLYPQLKGRPEIKRCARSEEFIQLSLT